jgi:hypothetical protein
MAQCQISWQCDVVAIPFNSFFPTPPLHFRMIFMHTIMEMSRTYVNNVNISWPAPDLSDTIASETGIFRHHPKAAVPNELSSDVTAEAA